MMEAKENILYYISGYIIKQIYKIIDCNSCLLSLVEKRSDHDYTIPLRHTKFVYLKDRGTLITSSNCVFKIIREIEITLMHFTNYLTNINIQNLEKKVISHLKNRFALDVSIFKHLNCNVEILERPHKLVLLTLIVKKFLSVRLHSFGKQFSSDFLNPVSKRQKLTKTILFYNQ